MFEYQPSRHPLQTFQFWFAVLVCIGGVTLWRFVVFQSSADEEQVLSAEHVEEELPPPPIDQLDLGESFELANLSPAPLQNVEEPVAAHLDSAPNGATGDKVDASLLPAKPFPGLNDVPQEQAPQNFEFTSAESNIQQLSGEESRSE